MTDPTTAAKNASVSLIHAREAMTETVDGDVRFADRKSQINLWVGNVTGILNELGYGRRPPDDAVGFMEVRAAVAWCEKLIESINGDHWPGWDQDQSVRTGWVTLLGDALDALAAVA